MTDENHNIDASELNRLFGVMLMIVGVMFAVAAYAWFQLPGGASIPVHWGINGEPNRFGGKAEGLLVMPCVALGIAMLFRVIPIIEPRRRNLLRSFSAYRAVGLSVLIFFLLIDVIKTGNLLGMFKLSMTSAIGLMMGVLFMLLGNYMGKVRSNFLFGIRTPWTLSSNIAWDKTHRLGGKLFFVTGLVGVVVNAAMPVVGLRLFIGLVALSAVVLVPYSWFVWRSAPDRRVN